MAVARITSKGQLTIPKDVRERLGIEPGDALEVRVERDHVEVWPVRQRRLDEFRGIFRVERALDFSEERQRAWDARGSSLTMANDPRDA